MLANVQVPPSLYEIVVAHDAEVLSDVRRDAGADLLAAAEALLEADGASWESEVVGGDPAICWSTWSRTTAAMRS